MKHIAAVTIISISLLLVSCRENREEEYRPRTETNDWIVATLNEHYLWNESMNESANRYAEPSIFFGKVITSSGNGGRADNFSFIDTEGNINRLEERTPSYGFEYYYETIEGRDLAARVLYVYKDSPAERAGLKRGDWITGINGIRLTDATLEQLETGPQTTLIRAACSHDEVDDTYTWTTTDTVTVAAADYFINSPIACDTTYNVGGKNIAYIKISPCRDNTIGNDRLQQALGGMASCDDMILDMRYCDVNDIVFINQLASAIAGSGHDGQTFLIKTHNANHSDNDSTICFSSQQTNLAKERLFVITDEDTGHENESLINGLKVYIDVITIGQNTSGSNAILGCFVCPSYPQYVIYPVVAAYCTEDEGIDCFRPITADMEVNERLNEISEYKAIGDTAEVMLSTALDVVINGLPVEGTE